MSIKITSNVFTDGDPIPDRNACKGVNVSPHLEWDIVSDAKSYAVICEDPDAPSGTWTHWIIYNLPSDTKILPEWIMEREELENGAKQGFNDFGTIGYRGPCPPGGTHRYYFRVYALDTELPLPARITKADLLDAMKDHIMDKGHIMGLYTR